LAKPGPQAARRPKPYATRSWQGKDGATCPLRKRIKSGCGRLGYRNASQDERKQIPLACAEKKYLCFNCLTDHLVATLPQAALAGLWKSVGIVSWLELIHGATTPSSFLHFIFK
jgi:hypothetical protein